MVKWLEWWILCHVNFTTMETHNKPPKEKMKMGKESCFGLMEFKKTWQLKAIYVCGLHPGLEGKFSSVQSCPTLWNPMDCSTPGLPVHHQLLEFTQTHVHWVGDAVQPSHPLSSPSPAFNLSQHQCLFSESILRIRWPEYWSFSFNISPSNEYSGLISFWMTGWISLQSRGLFKCLLQHHSSKASILRHSAFFIV